MLRDIFSLLTPLKINLNITAYLSILADHVHLSWPHCARLLKPEILSTKFLEDDDEPTCTPTASKVIRPHPIQENIFENPSPCMSVFFKSTSSLPSLVFSASRSHQLSLAPSICLDTCATLSVPRLSCRLHERACEYHTRLCACECFRLI